MNSFRAMARQCTSSGPSARRRVRIAVQACADEDLGRALEHAAEGEIEEAALQKHAVLTGDR